jgi:hypothetical protein
MSKIINLGIIGSSEGNGHPYSWSAIFNGYNKKIMENCGYPSIPRYLEKQKFPNDQIKEAKVTHIWTQNKKLSKHISRASKIKNVVNNMDDLISKVDAILLARDDAENHFKMSKKFLKAGLPIFIDKPMTLSVLEASKLFNLQKYEGQIFSCSAMRYAPEIKLTQKQKEKIGKIKFIYGYISNSWDKYAIHLIEPILKLIPNRGNIINHNVLHFYDKTSLSINFESRVSIQVNTFGKSLSPFYLRVIGTNGLIDIFFKDTFKAFKASLKDFVEGIINKDVRIKSNSIIEIIKLLELGRKIR